MLATVIFYVYVEFWQVKIYRFIHVELSNTELSYVSYTMYYSW